MRCQNCGCTLTVATDYCADCYEDMMDEANDHFEDSDCVDFDAEGDDGQPDEYTEWQDYMGGDDWDHGQYDSYDEY